MLSTSQFGGEVPYPGQEFNALRIMSIAVIGPAAVNTEGFGHPLTLTGNQDQLVQAIAAANPHTVVVLTLYIVVVLTLYIKDTSTICRTRLFLRKNFIHMSDP